MFYGRAYLSLSINQRSFLTHWFTSPPPRYDEEPIKWAGEDVKDPYEEVFKDF